MMIARIRHPAYWLLAIGLILVVAIYSLGLDGGWLFDDYPNIVENHGVQPADVSVASLVRAALSSPASEFKRPLASLSFAANYLGSGLKPYDWKLTNLLIHLVNGVLVFVLTCRLFATLDEEPGGGPRLEMTGWTSCREEITAALVAIGWMVLPINLTAVLYVVQRMESMANFFVLLGLIGYITGRQRMLGKRTGRRVTGISLCVASLIVATLLGLLAKETAVMLPLYAFLVEWIIFRFRVSPLALVAGTDTTPNKNNGLDRRIIALFIALLALPLAIGLAWLLPGLFQPGRWATRDFTLGSRLLSEARIVADYIAWTLFPTPGALSFYHDDFRISTGLLTPWTTLASMSFLAGLIALMLWMRQPRPLVALGIALFLGCHLLTGTVLPLELVYEHRNYFASFGLLLAIIPYLYAPRPRHDQLRAAARKTAVRTISTTATSDRHDIAAQSHATERSVSQTPTSVDAHPFPLARYTLLVSFLFSWTVLTALTSYAWGDPLRLAEDLAARAPQSPRAQYELGRTYIIYSHYQPDSPFTRQAYAPLEKSAALPNSSILPEQALIFMNARMHLPLREGWWDSMIAKLKARKPGVQDQSSLGALTQCAREGRCQLPTDRMTDAFNAALSHPNPNPRILATYGDYAWNVLKDHELGERMTEEAVKAAPGEPAYRITLVRMLAAQGRIKEAQSAMQKLEELNIGGRLNESLTGLRILLHLP